MPTFRDETIEYHKERVRDILVLKPTASARSIRAALEGDHENPLRLDRVYIGKLIDKIRAERARRYDRAKVEPRLAEIEDRTESVIEQMWRILLDVKTDEKARVGAAKVIIDADHKFLEAQMNAGIFERKLGTVEVEHQHTLAPEIAYPILRALRNYGIIRANPNPEFPHLPAGRTSDQRQAHAA